MKDERQLVLCAAHGNREAFGALAESCRPWLLARCYRQVRDPNTAEDLVQEALLLAFRDLAQLRDPDHFRSWLSQIAANVCHMHLRRVRARPQEMASEVVETAAAVADATVPFGLEEALAALSPTNRKLIDLVYRSAFSLSEAAEVLALSPSAVKSRLHRAREQLRKEMLTMAASEETWKLRTVLLVEPDAGVQTSLREGLTAAGYEVLVLSTGEAAIAAVRDRRGQCLILDKHCLEPHWLEVMALVQTHPWGLKNVPICVVVDPDNERDVFAAWHAGAAVCLTRPPEADRVVGYVRHLRETWGKGAQ